MGFESDIVEGAEDREPDRQAVIMEDKLRRTLPIGPGSAKNSLIKRPPRQSNLQSNGYLLKPARGSKGPIASRRADQPATARSKPFSMSYDGMTEAQYIKYRLDRGAR
jgi:hypothetical protein